MNFTAIDFETADQKRDSACAVSLVKVENSRITDRRFYLIKPPRKSFIFTYLHGISYDDVKDMPDFSELWPEIKDMFTGSDFLAAHNSSMDKSVLNACCSLYGISVPDIEFRCSMKLAREKWEIYPTRLENVISRLNIPVPHAPYRNAELCAEIFLYNAEMQNQTEVNVTSRNTEAGNVSVTVLGSSSAGNSTLIDGKNSAMLVDFGFAPKYFNQTFRDINFDFNRIRGAVITHLHSDHVKTTTIKEFIRRNIPVYIHPAMRKNFFAVYSAGIELADKGLLYEFSGNRAKIGEFEVEAFDVPHDASGGCFGYNIFYNLKKVSIATDIGYTNDFLVDKFKNSDIVVIEANHDTYMLENSNRTPYLINRIKSSGHLSNLQCRNFLDAVLKSSDKQPEGIILAHLSQECNTPDHAENEIGELLNQSEHNNIKLLISAKNAPVKFVSS